MQRAAGGLCSADRPLLRSVLRPIANMTFKLFLHCLVCELEVQVDFVLLCIFFFAVPRHGAQAGTMVAATSVSPPPTRLYHT